MKNSLVIVGNETTKKHLNRIKGVDLDIHFSELDDRRQDIGNEGEKNNYYSLNEIEV